MDVAGKYIELNADALREAYKRHSEPKEAGNIPLSREDFRSIPEYINEFDDVLAVDTYKGRTEVHLYKEVDDGYIRILTVVSGERNSIQITKLLGVSKEAFLAKYAKKIERDAGPLRGQIEKSKASNPSTTAQSTDGALPTSKIAPNNGTVKRQFSLSDNQDYAPTFYSQMGKVVDGVKQSKLGAASVVPMLRGKGVKAEEIKWSGIEQFLEGKKSVTKQELQAFIAGSQLQIEETERTEAIRYSDEQRAELDRLEEENDKWFDQMSDNWYALFNDGIPIEILGSRNMYGAASRKLDARGKGATPEAKAIRDAISAYDKNELLMEAIRDEAKDQHQTAKWKEYTLEGGENYREYLFKMPDSNYSNQAMKAHWGSNNPGVLAHARVQDFEHNGDKVLFIEEIQSDWHNAGHKYGYGDIDAELARLQAEYEERVALRDKWQAKLDEYNIRTNDYGEHIEDYYDVYDEYMSASARVEDSQRRIRNAKRGDFGVAPEAPFSKNYHEFVLKNLLRKAAEGGYDYVAWTPGWLQEERWSSEYAEGYRIEYDQDIPKFLNKYGKQWGAHTEDISLDGLKNMSVHAIPVTPAMKQSVLYEGQPQYSLSDDDTENLATEGGVKVDSIREGMSDEERYNALRDKSISVRTGENTATFAEDIAQIEALPARAKSRVEKVIRPLAHKLGILGRDLETPDVELKFQFSANGGLRESLHQQLRYGGNYTDFSKALINLDQILEDARLIEVHGDKYKGTVRENRNLEKVFVLFGAFADGDYVIPVQMEIKKSSIDGGKLYMTVAMTKIEAGVMGSPDGTSDHANSLLPTSEFSIAKIFKEINPADKHFLKYIPDGFLTDEQIRAKDAAIAEDNARIAKYTSKGMKPQNSLSDDDTDWMLENFGNGENSADRYSDDTLADGTVLMSKAQSIQGARDLKSKYNSRASTEMLAAMYRQLSQVGVELSDGYLKQFGLVDAGDQSGFAAIDQDNQRIGEEMERIAYEIADAVIDGATRIGREYSEEILAALRSSLDQPIYVAEADKQTFAETLGYESWGEARKARLNILGKTTNDPAKGIEIASVYEALVEQFPGAVKRDVRSQADQLEAIVNAYDNAIEAKYSSYNPLAYSAEVKEQNRKAIADEVCADLYYSAYQYAEEQYKNALIMEKAKARRLEREAKEAERKAAEASKNNADPELVKKLESEGKALREQSEEAKLMGQTDSETIMEGMAEGGFKPKTADEVVAAWAKQSQAKTELTPEQVIQLAVKRVMQRKDRQPSPKVSQTYSNTLVGGGLISEVERTMDGLRPQDMTYDPKTEKQSLTEAAARLDSDYLKWYGALPNKDAWTGVDLDTAMLILGQVQAEAENSGDFSSVVRWAQLIKDHTSQNAQMLQSLAKYSRTAVGTVTDAARNLDEQYVNESGDSKALRKLRKSNRDNADKLDEVTARNDELDAEWKKLLEQYEAIKGELEAARKEGRGLDNKVETARAKLLKAIDTLEKQNKLSDQLTGELERLMDSLSWKLAELSNVSRDNKNVLMEKQRLERRLNTANKRYQKALDRNKTLRAALDGLRNLGLTSDDINHLTKIVESQNEYMDKLLTVLADQKTAAARANGKAGSTQSASARKRAATQTASKEVNAMAQAVQDDLDKTLSADKKAKLIADMAEFASILDATKEGDKARLIQLIIRQSERRNIKVSKTMRRWLDKQEWQYLHDFAVTQLANIADDYIPRAAGKKMATWQYLAQLLNVKTSLRNVISNAVFYAQEGFAKNVGALIDMGISAATKTRTVGFSTARRGETGRLAGAAERARRSGLEVSLDVAVGNSFSKYGEGSNRTFKKAQKGISHAVGRVLSTAEKVNGYSLTVTDEYFKGAVYQSTVNSLASLVSKGKLSQQEAEDIAQRQVLYNTFQDETAIGSALEGLHDFLNGTSKWFKTHDVPVLRSLEGIGLGDFVIKYRTVPGALVTRALEYSPAGYLKAIFNASQLVRYGRQSKELEQQMRSDGKGSVSEDTIADVRAKFIKAQNNVSMGLARATTGSGLVAAFWALALKGIIGNADEEEDEDAKAVNAAEGLSGTQLNISALGRFINGQSAEWQAGDDLIDIGFLDPTGSAITMGTMIANLQEAEGENWFSTWYNANKGMALQSFSDLSMMDTLNDILYTFTYHDDESDLDLVTEVGITFATSMVTSMEPSLIRQLAQASDEYYRDTYGGSGAIYDATKDVIGEESAEALQTAANEIAVNIPGLRQMVDTKLDSFGREKTYGDSTAANVINALVNPAKYAQYNPSEASRELRRLYRETGDATIYPDRNAPGSVQFGDERISLTPNQKRQWQTDMGQNYDRMLGEMMSGDAYQNANNERKVELLNDLESYVEYKAKQGIYSESHDGQTYINDDWNKTEAGMGIGIAFGEMRQILKDTNETNMPSDVEDGETVSGSREGKIMDYLNDLEYSDKEKLELYGIIRGAGATSSTEKLESIMDSGLSFKEATDVRKVYNELNASRDANASGMRDRDVFEQYLREQGFSAKEREIINDSYKFYTQIPQEEDSTISKLTAAGMDYDTSYDIAASLEALEPEAGEDVVSTSQKYNEIVGSSKLSTYEKQQTIAAISGSGSAFGSLNEDVAEALMNVYATTGVTSVLSLQPADSITVNYKEYEYSEEQYEASTNAYLEIMNQMGGGYLTDAKLVAGAKDIASNAARYAALTEGGYEPDLEGSDYSAYRKALQATEVGLDLSYYVAVKAAGNEFTADTDANGKTVSGSKKEKVVKYLKGLGLSSEQYKFFYSTVFGYK